VRDRKMAQAREGGDKVMGRLGQGEGWRARRRRGRDGYKPALSDFRSYSTGANCTLSEKLFAEVSPVGN
jgi:hypothetical protein